MRRVGSRRAYSSSVAKNGEAARSRSRTPRQPRPPVQPPAGRVGRGQAVAAMPGLVAQPPRHHHRGCNRGEQIRPHPRIGEGRALGPVQQLAVDQHLGDLHSVERGTLAEVVVADEQHEALAGLRRLVGADATGEDLVLAGGLEGVGHGRHDDAVGPGARDDELPLNFRDSWRVALGANYKFAPDWKWKFGVAFDQSPVYQASDRPTSLPDNDRYWFSTGVQWQAGKNTTLDVGYTYLYLRKTDIDTTSGNALTKGRVAGTYDSNAHILGVQLSSRF